MKSASIYWQGVVNEYLRLPPWSNFCCIHSRIPSFLQPLILMKILSFIQLHKSNLYWGWERGNWPLCAMTAALLKLNGKCLMTHSTRNCDVPNSWFYGSFCSLTFRRNLSLKTSCVLKIFRVLWWGVMIMSIVLGLRPWEIFKWQLKVWCDLLKKSWFFAHCSRKMG